MSGYLLGGYLVFLNAVTPCHIEAQLPNPDLSAETKGPFGEP
jgi:hypothetical protein